MFGAVNTFFVGFSWVRLQKILSIGITFALVSFAWIFFRANSFSDAIYISSHLFTGCNGLEFAKIIMIVPTYKLLAILGALLLMEVVQAMEADNKCETQVRQTFWCKSLVYFFLVFSILDINMLKATPFIYFQF